MDRAGWIRATAAAAIVGAFAWFVKFVTIVVQDGGESWIDVTAFFVGLVLIAVGSTSLALRLTRGRGGLLTTLACLGCAAVTVLMVGGLSIVSNALFGADTFIGTEGGVTVLALLSLAVGITGLRAGRDRSRVAVA